MRYGRLSVADVKALRHLISDCRDQAQDGAIWWAHRHDAARLIRDEPMRLYAEHRRANAQACAAACATWLADLPTVTTVEAIVQQPAA